MKFSLPKKNIEKREKERVWATHIESKWYTIYHIHIVKIIKIQARNPNILLFNQPSNQKKEEIMWKWIQLNWINTPLMMMMMITTIHHIQVFFCFCILFFVDSKNNENEEFFFFIILSRNQNKRKGKKNNKRIKTNYYYYHIWHISFKIEWWLWQFHLMTTLFIYIHYP